MARLEPREPSPLGWILVADADGAAARRVTAKALRWGLPAYATTRGDDALRAASGRRVVLAIVDVVLEDMAGHRLAARLRSHDPTLAVVITTADPRPETEQLARQAGITHYAPKPVDARRLRALVARSLQRRTQRR